jgi:anthranilate synthase component I
MKLAPSFEDFSERFDAGQNQVVWTRLVADLDTPVSLMLKLTEARKDSFLLESGDRRRGARALFLHGHEARPDLAVPGPAGADQPRGALRSGGLLDGGGEPLESLRG